MLADICQALGVTAAAPEKEITGITADSRKVTDGALFVAVNGVDVDGHRFIPQALEKGAAAVICERIPDHASPEVEWIKVNDSREALGLAASAYYRYPTDELTLVGVTGTNGKTTIATLLYHMARKAGMKAGLISTVENIIDEERIPSEHTTPDAVALNALLRRMADAGCRFAAMEVSSHAADQHRIAGLTFAGAIFTNITRDHLDYHKTFANYLAAKKSFFDGLGKDAFALTNADDRNGAVMLQNTGARRASYSLYGGADFNVKVLDDRLDGMLLEIDGKELETFFSGRFNASNLAAVYGACRLLGMPREDVLVAMSSLHPVAGRFQTFRSADGVTAIVDYAHTPDAIANVLDAITETDPGARVTVVTGAGGNRDKGKRPLMAAAAIDRASRLVLTSDNPRHEQAMDIINDMLAGVPEDRRDDVTIEPDRARAISDTIASAESGDVILVAGKGHETYQIIGDTVNHFDDREHVSAALAERDNNKAKL